MLHLMSGYCCAWHSLLDMNHPNHNTLAFVVDTASKLLFGRLVSHYSGSFRSFQPATANSPLPPLPPNQPHCSRSSNGPVSADESGMDYSFDCHSYPLCLSLLTPGVTPAATSTSIQQPLSWLLTGQTGAGSCSY